MKNNTTPKKAWQKPEVSDLDVNSLTASSKSTYHAENTGFAPTAS